jgi:hypothetical protein
VETELPLSVSNSLPVKPIWFVTKLEKYFTVNFVDCG